MKDNYYLALADDVELGNKIIIKRTIAKLFMVATILLISGLCVVRLNIGNKQIYKLMLIAFLTIYTYTAKHFILTTKTFNQKLRLKGTSGRIMFAYLILLIFLISIELMNMFPLFKLQFSKILFAALSALISAVFEEFIFRGILFNAFLLLFCEEKYDILCTSIVCSILFSLIHMNNLTSQSFISTVGQMIFTLAFGLILSCLRLWSNRLAWCIALHFLQDFSPKIISTNYGISKIGLVILLYFPIIIFVLICIWTINKRYLELRKKS